VMLFQAVMKFLSRLVEFKILVNWGMVHSLFNLTLSQTFLTNPSRLRIYQCKIPTVITEVLIL
jgi:hypothetical protein